MSVNSAVDKLRGFCYNHDMLIEEQYPNWKLKIIVAHLLLKRKADKKRSEAGRLERVKADPERLARKRETGRRNAQKRRDRIKSDPELFEKERVRLNSFNRDRYAHRRVNEPGFADKHRARISAYNKTENGRRIQSEQMSKRRAESIEFKMASAIRSRIADVIRGRAKFGNLSELIGCSMSEFISHIEGQFIDGMFWHNYGNGDGRWNIDHKVPIAAHDISTEDGQKKAFHFTNCQPMWFKENCSKNSIVDGVKKRYSDHVPAQI